MTVPLVFFAFNRPDTTRLVLDALREQTMPPELIIAFADGPRDKTDEPQVNVVRQIIRAVNWTEVQLVERDRNIGPAMYMVHGLSEVFRSYSKAIVVEDDILPSRCFCQSMCDLLESYEQVPSVFSVGGFPSLKPDALPNYPFDVVMSPRFCSLGWGTWADKWRNIESNLFNFRSPFANRDGVPLCAGEDIPNAVEFSGIQPGPSWEYRVALLSLYHGWFHALTRHYLTKSIGLRSGTHRLGLHATRFVSDYSPLTERVPTYFPPAEHRHDVCLATQDYIRDYLRAINDEFSLSPFEKRVKELVSNYMHLDTQRSQLNVSTPDSWQAGFFANCTFTLQALTSTYPSEAFVRVNWPSQSLWRDSDQAGKNLFDLYFDQNTKADCHQFSCLPPIDSNGAYAALPFERLTPYLKSYFLPSSAVRQRQEQLEIKYNIDYEQTVALVYRGTDKFTELSPISPKYYIWEVSRLLAKENEIRVLVQTDQKQVRDQCVTHFGSRAFYVDELPVTTSLTGIHHIPAESRGLSNFQFGVSLLAVANIIAKCKYLVTGTGNLGCWAILYRGSAENTAQFRPKAPALISNFAGNPIGSTDTESNLRADEVYELRFENAQLNAVRDGLQAELRSIRSSLGYRFMKLYASRIDKLFPDGTSRGALRKKAATHLQAMTKTNEE